MDQLISIDVFADVACPLSRAQVAAVLDSDMYVDDIAASQQEAQREGISGVPFYIIDGRYGVEGAQTAGVWLRAFELYSIGSR